MDERSTTGQPQPPPHVTEVFCPAHPEQRSQGNGKKYFLHLLQPEQLQQRGINAKKAQLILNAYPVLVLSDEWLEELFAPMRQQPLVPRDQTRHGGAHGALGTQELWEQVAHVDPTAPNPTVSDYTRRNARRPAIKRVDGKRFFD